MIFIYDGSYEGLLSCIFVIFKERITPVAINAEDNYQFALLDTARRIDTNEDWAARVLKGIDGRTNASASALINKITSRKDLFIINEIIKPPVSLRSEEENNW